MSNKKQTAVEWLEEIASKGFISPEKFEKAKEMEKQQIIDAANQNDFVLVPGFGIYEDLSAGKQYYNETYETK